MRGEVTFPAIWNSPPRGMFRRAETWASPAKPRREWKIRSTSVIDTSPSATNVVRADAPVSMVPAATRLPKEPASRTVSKTMPCPGSMWKRVARLETIGSAAGSDSFIRRAVTAPL